MKLTSKTMSLPTLFFNPKFLVIFIIKFILISTISSNAHTTSSLQNEQNLQNNEQEIPLFRKVNRRHLIDCLSNNPYLQITVSTISPLSDEQYINVTVSGISQPSDKYWVAMISPSHSSVKYCPLNSLLYKQTGDLSNLPLLCHYPVKAAYLKNDPDFLTCKKSECKKKEADGSCTTQTCTTSITFHVINIRTDIEFVLFNNGFQAPCILKRTSPLPFANPNKPLYGHISSC